ncbi:MAG: hypothetical protein HY263_05580 [Chloroflexi bacterium]|nr:hypothetical protein [Chloroflexota bacterium]
MIPEGESSWQDLAGPDQVVRFYDPTDVFGDLAEAIAEAYPDAVDDEDADSGEAETADGENADADTGDAS